MMRPDSLFSRKTNGECVIGLDCRKKGEEGLILIYARLSSENFIDGGLLKSAFKGMKRKRFGAYDIRTMDTLVGWIYRRAL